MRFRRRCRCLILVAAVWMLAGGARAQEASGPAYTLVLRGVPLQEALERFGRLTRVDLVYTSSLVDGRMSYCDGRGLSAGTLLGCVLAGSGLDFVRSSSGAYVLITAVQVAPRLGELGGSVVDGETGEPLPFASVLLADARAGTTTNEDGLFGFSALLPGQHRVLATYVGYETAADSVWLAPGGSERVRLVLRPRTTPLEPIVVDGLEQRLPSGGLGRGELKPASWMAASGAAPPDVARAATTLLGVASRQPLADLHIQGGATGEHLTLLDGVAVRDPVSLGRYQSAFSPLAVGRIAVHKAGFGAERGSHLSGVVAVEQSVGGTDRENVAISVDPLAVNGRAQARLELPGGRSGAAMVAVRYGTWSLYRDPGLSGLLDRWGAVDPLIASRWLGHDVRRSTLGAVRYDPTVAFSDVHAAVRLRPSPFRVVHASAYRAGNHVATELSALDSGSGYGTSSLLVMEDDYDWANWAAQVRHAWLLGARSIVTLQVLAGLHESSYAYYGRYLRVRAGLTDEERIRAVDSLRALPGSGPASDEHNRIGEVTLKAVVEHSFAPRRHVEAGLEAARTDSRLRFANDHFGRLWHETKTWNVGGYARGEIGLGLRTTIESGLRATYLPRLGTIYLEPRLALRYDREASAVGPYALRLAAGVYRQFTNQYELTSAGASAAIPAILFWLPLDGTLAPPRVHHLAAEALFTPAPGWTLSLEGYFKAQPRLLTLDYAAFGGEEPYEPYDVGPAEEAADQAAFVEATRGKAYGGGVRLRREGRRGGATVSYTFGRALRRYPSRFADRLLPVPWSTPHRLVVDAEARLGRGFGAGVGWEGGWGRAWGFRRGYYDYLGDAPVEGLNLTDPSADSLPPYYRLDAGVTFSRSWGRAAVHVRASVANLLDRRNVYDRSLEAGPDGVASFPRLLPGRQPSFTLRVSY